MVGETNFMAARWVPLVLKNTGVERTAPVGSLDSRKKSAEPA